jgi:hypothetical protein
LIKKYKFLKVQKDSAFEDTCLQQQLFDVVSHTPTRST